MEEQIEHEICGNCKKEIPQHNYVMHTAHCARRLALCPACREPIPKPELESHRLKCAKKQPKAVSAPIKAKIESSRYFAERKTIEESKAEVRRLKKLEKLEQFGAVGHRLGTPSPRPLAADAATVAPPAALLACEYCALELPEADLAEHVDYCGSRTDKCLECGELVMFKRKQIHLDSNHGFVKLSDEPGPKASWDSSTERVESPSRRPRTTYGGFDSTLYSFPASPIAPAVPKGESYKDISRRLDCKTEYIRNLLHDSASITVPLRHSGAVPRNHFNHNKGPAPQPPRRRNPPTELTIPCEFCQTPIPHQELIQHETGCRPDLARFSPRRNRLYNTEEEDEYFMPPQAQAQTEEIDLPCEFCADMIPASELLRHQMSCVPIA